ncbi:MAG: DUF1559 domain-containing protein, partial [Pirellula sp.]
MAAVGLPAIQAAREASRIASCKNNVLQIGAALNAHESVRKVYPSGGWGYYWYTLSDRSGTAQPGGWIYPILPYMEQQAFYSRTPNTNDLRMEGDPPFGGSHPGITVFVRCDGSVQSISNDIEPDTLARLGHI